MSSYLDDGSDFENDEPLPEVSQFDAKENGYEHLNINLESLNLKHNVEESKVAFRELYQNFRDGITATHNIQPQDLEAEIKTENIKGYHIITIAFYNKKANVRAKQGEKLCGYVQFRRKLNDSSGEVTLVNFGATLSSSSFRMWQSSKQHSSNQAGRHGEGLKRAAKFLVSVGCSLVIESGERIVRFKDSKGCLCMKWTNPKNQIAKQIDKWEKSGRLSPRGFESHIWEDVAVKIADEKNGPSGLPSEKIDEHLFKEWLRVTCDINGPRDKISTPAGDLILDPDLRGAVYLKGLKLDRSAFGSAPFHYGYNLYSGDIGRDRSTMRYPKQEAKIIHSIWGHALTQSITQPDAVTKNNLEGKLFEIFQYHADAPDVALANKFMEHRTIVSLWKYMLQRARKTGVFYIKQGDKQASFIVRRDLGCQPEELDEKLWNILRTKDGICRTPQEERDHRFENCEQFSIDGCTWFARHAWYAFSALTKYCHAKFQSGTEEDAQTELDIKAIHGKDLSVRCLYRPSKKVLLVNGDKFQDFEEAHRIDKSCPAFSSEEPTNDEIFRCDHHILEWFVDALEAISESPKEPLERRDITRYAGKTGWILSQMPRGVRCEPTRNANELKISWLSNDQTPGQEALQNMTWIVQLHSDRCGKIEIQSTLEDNGLHGDHIELRGEQQLCCNCGGQSKLVKVDQRYAIFTNVDPAISYTPLVKKNVTDSIAGMSISPARALRQSKAPSPSDEHEDDVEMSPPNLTTTSFPLRAYSGENADHASPPSPSNSSTTSTFAMPKRSSNLGKFSLRQNKDPLATSYTDDTVTFYKDKEISVRGALAFSTADCKFHVAKFRRDNEVGGIMIEPKEKKHDGIDAEVWLADQVGVKASIADDGGEPGRGNKRRRTGA